jgi:ATP-dependent Clp protease protease subunit
MEQSKVPVHTIATGAAMSCGFTILMYGHERFAYEHAVPMYHQISGGAWGETQQMEEKVKQTKILQKKWEQMVISKTKITKTKLKEIRKTKFDWYMTAKDALKYGVVDHII